MAVISYEEALATVLRTAQRGDAAEVALVDCVGMALAEDVCADRDHPPFDRSAMDGYSVRSEDLARLPADLRVIEEVAAGHVPARRIGRGECAKVMTGAPVSEGADTVVIVEDTADLGSERVRILKAPPCESNICRQGEDCRRGDVIVPAGRMIRTQELAVLAAVGKTRVAVWRAPTVAVLSTGSEVVPVAADPRPGQVRDSNAPVLAARLARMGISVTRLGIVHDDEEALRPVIERGLEADVLLISGGVSMGDFDLVPGILRSLGVDILFEKVAMKPGKPTVLGRRGKTLVFGLPGNPVSVRVTTEVFVVPALKTMMGLSVDGPVMSRAILDETVSHKSDRRSHVPVRLARKDGRLTAEPIEYHGSGDIVALAGADALLVLPLGVNTIQKGAEVQIVILDAERLA